jgi:hypothetical protein
MQISTGRVCKVLHDAVGHVNGFSLDSGLDVRFPPDRAASVFAVVTPGFHVEIHARMRKGLVGEAYADARFVTNLDSRRYVDLHASATPPGPEVSTVIYAAPRKETPLAPAFETMREIQPLATANEVADEIEQAYDGFHRTTVGPASS